MKKTIGIVMAMNLEAKPFIDGLQLQQISSSPFNLYRNDRIYLLICGLGPPAARRGTEEIISRCGVACALNLGAAGATAGSADPGTVYAIDRVTLLPGPDDPGPRYEPMEILGGFPTARLITAERPVLTTDERKRLRPWGELIDMEGAGFLRACRMHGIPPYCFKFVSDTDAHDRADIIIENIRTMSFEFYRYAADRILPLLLQ